MLTHSIDFKLYSPIRGQSRSKKKKLSEDIDRIKTKKVKEKKLPVLWYEFSSPSVLWLMVFDNLLYLNICVDTPNIS